MYPINKNPKNNLFLGLNFPNKVGLAAGFDKNAAYIDIFSDLGFGHVEIGTVTPLPQNGNEKPRLFRLKQDQALINRMGFNNDGADAVVKNLKKRTSSIIVGGNIGKNKLTPNEFAINDYLICFDKLYDWVDYFVLNVSSPNTPNLRALQDKEPLQKLIQSIINKRNEFVVNQKPSKPILLKIAPDLTLSQLDEICEIISNSKLDGIIATNTTIDRTELITNSSFIEKIGAGGLSGKPIKVKSTYVQSYLRKKLPSSYTIIGVGGIHSAQDAIDKLNAGANLVQIYTGFVYEGNKLVSDIVNNT